MIDITTGKNGKIEKVRTVEYKAFNLLNTRVGDMVYFPIFGFPLEKYVNGRSEINYNNVISEINTYFLENNIHIEAYESEIKDFLNHLQLTVKGDTNAI